MHKSEEDRRYTREEYFVSVRDGRLLTDSALWLGVCGGFVYMT